MKRKLYSDTAIHVRVPEWLYVVLVELALERNCTLSHLVREALGAVYEQNAPAQGTETAYSRALAQLSDDERAEVLTQLTNDTAERYESWLEQETQTATQVCADRQTETGGK